MARGPSTFRKQDLTRAIKATVDAGVTAFRVKVGKDGALEIDIGLAPAAAGPAADDTPDSVRALI